MANGPDHVLRNRVAWDELAASYAGPGAEAWSQDEPHWGTFGVPEAEAGVLPPDVAGLDAIELGCGTAYVSAWLARQAPAGAVNPSALQSAEWAHRWPCEEVWKARKPDEAGRAPHKEAA